MPSARPKTGFFLPRGGYLSAAFHLRKEVRLSWGLTVFDDLMRTVLTFFESIRPLALLILFGFAAITVKAQQPANRVYQNPIGDFLKENIDGLIAEIQSSPDLRKEICGSARDGEFPAFGKRLGDRIQKSLTAIYSQPSQARQRFGSRTKDQVYIEAGRLYTNQSKQVSDRVRSLCTNQRPKADAGPDIITIPNNPIRLKGTASDPDQDPLSFRWTQRSRNAAAQISTPTSLVTEVNGLQVGTYQFTLTVSDNHGSSDSASATVTVRPGPPKANAGNDFTIALPTNFATLSGSGTDPNGSVLIYNWSKVDNTSGGQIASSNARTTTINNLQPGKYQYRLTVTNQYQLSATDEVVVTVIAPRQPPTANAGPDITITMPTNFGTLNGSGTDPNGSTLIYNWSKTDNSSGGQIASPNTRTTTINNLQPGKYQYRFTVTNQYQLSATDEVVVTVTVPQQPPTANAGPDVKITLPTNFATLNGSGTDPNGSVLTYSWSKATDKNGGQLSNPSASTTSITNLHSGTYQYLLTVTNQNGLSATDGVSVIVQEPISSNLSPTINAGPDQTITLPTNRVELIGSATDPDNDPLTYRWRRSDGSNVFSIESPSSSRTFVDNLQAGVYYFELEVSDNHNHTARDIVRIEVNEQVKLARPVPPTVDAGPDQELNFSKNMIAVFSANGKDSDGTISSYQWRQVGGPKQVKMDSPFQAQTNVEDLSPGKYIFQVTVRDNQGLVAADIVILTIISESKIWIWILIAAIGGIATAVTLYFVWLWKKQKVIVYFLNEHEEALAHSYMHGSDKTDGYYLGRLSRRKIKTLKKKGIAIRILNTAKLIVNTPGVSRQYKLSLKRKVLKVSETKMPYEGSFENLAASMVQTEDFTSTLPAFFIITLDGPLVPQFKLRLKEIGVDILQRVPDESYIVLIRQQEQLQRIEFEKETSFKFIRLIRPYMPEDTGVMVRRDHIGEAIMADLVLHRDEDAPTVSDFLRTNQVEQVASYRNIIRIWLRPTREMAMRLASNKFIQAIYECIPPTLYNDVARRIVGIDAMDKLECYLDQSGEGEIIAVADTGIDTLHPDLKGRIKNAVSWGRKENQDFSDPHGHGTHVTGSIVGSGDASQGKVKGMAPDAQIFFQSLLTDNGQLCDLKLELPDLLKQAYDQGARILNISWGSATESNYRYDSVALDQFVYEYPEMLIVVAAGNEAKMIKDNRSGKNVSLFGSVGSPATTKNGLTVGASRSSRNNEDALSIASFSSRGPCRNDRRVKPDIVAPGTNILSTRSSTAPNRNFEDFYFNPSYAFLGGTSMATPIVSGAAALVREYYKKSRNCPRPSAALIKATLLNGTTRLGSESAMQASDIIPNNNQGFGRLDMRLTIPNKFNDLKLHFCDGAMDETMLISQTGEKKIFKLSIHEKTWLRACMVFTDNPKPGMQSDLNLIVSLDETNLKWTGNSGINTKEQYLSADETDFTNNIEIVRVEDAEVGSYSIAVETTTAPTEGKVGFALVVTTGDQTSEFVVETI